MTSKNKNTHQKSIEEYRRDIFVLKNKLKSEEEYLMELRQKYQNVEILGDKSYTFSMKLKILEYTLNDIRAKLQKFTAEPQYEYYCLNFATLALIKSCEIIGLSRQMIFRGVDANEKGQVGWFDFHNFLREVMRKGYNNAGLDSDFINPIMKAICPDESQPVTQKRYDTFLSSFLLKTEQNGQQIDNLDGAIDRIAIQLIKQEISPSKLWKQKQVNIAVVLFSLLTNVKFIDILDCVACYCKCDPLKVGVINSSAVISLLQHKIADQVNFTKIKLKK